jgi:hypothetical protein
MNVVEKNNSAQARALAIKCIKLEKFYANSILNNRNATIALGGVVFTLFTASRFVTLNREALSSYLEGIGKAEARKLYDDVYRPNGKLKREPPKSEHVFE